MMEEDWPEDIRNWAKEEKNLQHPIEQKDAEKRIAKRLGLGMTLPVLIHEAKDLAASIDSTHTAVSLPKLAKLALWAKHWIVAAGTGLVIGSAGTYVVLEQASRPTTEYAVEDHIMPTPSAVSTVVPKDQPGAPFPESPLNDKAPIASVQQPAPVQPKTKTARAPSVEAKSMEAPNHSLSDRESNNIRDPELALIRQARMALLKSQPQLALDAIQKQRTLYPRSTWAEDRDALEVFALVGLNKKMKAKAAGERFLREYPHSPFRDRIKKAIFAD